MGQIANTMLIEQIKKLIDKLKAKKEEKKTNDGEDGQS